ncbi:FMRFamide receptor-like [Brachionus plicatilis]|uniref:FMRFamide receptor-like n=1 Tax=Brachionus plicatilis TaxID=10195 RepID=A0A3M7SC11_BRAPC|nr:FMRFamide receptor-like [Brachionus plicatilis]
MTQVHTENKIEYIKLFEHTQLVTGLYLLPFISLFGIIGSIFNILVYKNSKKYSTNVYLIALSVSDIVKLVNDFLYFLVSLLSRLDSALGNYFFNQMYLYSHYIFVTTAINTAWLTCSIALDRYFILMYNRGHQKYRKYFFSILMSLFIAMMSSVIAIPAPLFLKSVQEIDPATNQTVSKVGESTLNDSNFKIVYSYFNAIFRAFIPLVIIIYLNFKTVRIVYEKKMKKKPFSKLIQKKEKSKSKITIMLIVIVLTFTVCMFPDAIMTMMQLGYANETYLVRSVREITDLLLAVNSATTFPICYYFSLQYRAKFKELCGLYRADTNQSVTRIRVNENASFFVSKAGDETPNLIHKNTVNANSEV